MMNWIFLGLIVLSILFGALTGRIEQVSAAALQDANTAVQLVISLLGTICLWSGLMRIAEKAELTEKLARLFSPLTNFLFKGLPKDSKAKEYICMNMAANLMGLGNAATPFGISAMTALEKEEGYPTAATNNMVMFVVVNTASLQLIPTTTAALRLAAGSASPLEIMPAVWVASVVSLGAGVIMAKVCGLLGGKKTWTR